jgi:hypothetical protein
VSTGCFAVATGCLAYSSALQFQMQGDSVWFLRWRDPSAPSVSGPIALSLKHRVPVAGPAFFKTWLQYRGREKYDPRGLREAAQAASDEDACLFKPVIAHCLLFASGSDWSQWARDALTLMLSSSNPLIWQWIQEERDCGLVDDDILEKL